MSFSPRNGEVILKNAVIKMAERVPGFSPRNGEVILKKVPEVCHTFSKCFSPRNGEVILKQNEIPVSSISAGVSVPAMGK